MKPACKPRTAFRKRRNSNGSARAANAASARAGQHSFERPVLRRAFRQRIPHMCPASLDLIDAGDRRRFAPGTENQFIPPATPAKRRGPASRIGPASLIAKPGRREGFPGSGFVSAKSSTVRLGMSRVVPSRCCVPGANCRRLGALGYRHPPGRGFRPTPRSGTLSLVRRK
jgi:hypothetical protein